MSTELLLVLIAGTLAIVGVAGFVRFAHRDDAHRDYFRRFLRQVSQAQRDPEVVDVLMLRELECHRRAARAKQREL